MLELQGQRRFRRLLYSPLSLALLFLLVLVLMHSVWGLYQKNKLSRYHRDQAAAELTELTAQKEVLTANVENLRHKRGMEEEIRKNYSVILPGERVVIIVDEEEEVSSTTTTNKQAGGWSKFKQLFDF